MTGGGERPGGGPAASRTARDAAASAAVPRSASAARPEGEPASARDPGFGAAADRRGRRPPPARGARPYPRDWPAASELDRRPEGARLPHNWEPQPDRERHRDVVRALRSWSSRGSADRRRWPLAAASVPSPSVLRQWERETAGRLRRLLGSIPADSRRLATAAIFLVAAGLGGMSVGDRPNPDPRELGRRNAALQLALDARDGELAVMRLEVERLRQVSRAALSYGIPVELASSIYDAARSEDIDPVLAFALVRVESGFHPRAVSPVGAIGLTQVMPATAFELDPSLRFSDLFARETNLRLGFRYLRQLLDRYDGDLRVALLAYNRGPGTVDALRARGLDPANGYARAVLSLAARNAPSTPAPAASRP